MKIRISETTSPQINKALMEFEGARTQNLLSARELMARAQRTEKQLEDMGVPKCKRQEAEIVYGGGGGAQAKSYRYPIKTTVVRMVRKATGWFLVDHWTDDLYPQTKRPDRLLLTPEQDNIAVESFRRQYRVKSV